jgi:hypothetical protein
MRNAPGTGRRPRAWHDIACALAVVSALSSLLPPTL